MLFGTGAVITPVPVDVTPGKSFFHAHRALKPVTDAMRIGIDLGKATEEKKKQVLSGPLHLRDIGDVKVEACKSQTDCVPLTYSGPYFSRDNYGIGFDGSGPQFEHARFVGVRITVNHALHQITISWSNYVQ